MALEVPRLQADSLVGPESNVIDATSRFLRATEEAKKSKIALAGTHAFLDPEADTEGQFAGADGLAEQLRFMGRFWRTFSEELCSPKIEDLSVVQRAWLGSLAAGVRVVPSPLLSYDTRLDLAESGLRLAGNTLNPRRQMAMVSAVMRGLLRSVDDPKATYPTAEGTHVLRYKLNVPGRNGTREARLLDRAAYTEALLARGEAVVWPDTPAYGRQSALWILSLVDMKARQAGSRTSVGEQYEALDHTVTTETQLALQLLDQANGSPRPDVLGISNELLAVRPHRFGGRLAVQAVMGMRYLEAVNLIQAQPLTLDSCAGDAKEYAPRTYESKMVAQGSKLDFK